MSWYYGTFYCGHEGYVNLNGSLKMRRKMKEYRFSQLCPDCSRSDAIRFRQKRNSHAMELTRRMELPQLEGSTRQIAWATSLRLDICSRLEHFIEFPSHLSAVLERFERESGSAVDLSSDTIPQIFQEFIYYLQNTKKNSVYWIDRRYVSSFQILTEALPDFLIWRDHKKNDFLQETFLNAEALLSPEQIRHPGFVVLKGHEKELRAYYEKNDIFQTVMKSQRFHWNGEFWVRSLNEYSGTAKDRLAQVGNVLLNEGFRVSIDDPIAREHAICADFLPEHTRWIMRGMNTRQLYIELTPDLSPCIRQNLMRIPTASYRYGSILVDLSHYEELEDFAQMYNFHFDREASRLLNQYKSLLKNARCVQPVKPDPAQPIDQLRRILESSGSILEDLCDDMTDL